MKKHVYLSAIILTKFKNRILQHKKIKQKKSKTNLHVVWIYLYMYIFKKHKTLLVRNYIGASQVAQWAKNLPAMQEIKEM